MNQIEKKCEGKCPRCGGDNINWRVSESQDGSVFYIGVCEECDCDFTEHHCLVYEITQYEEI